MTRIENLMLCAALFFACAPPPINPPGGHFPPDSGDDPSRTDGGSTGGPRIQVQYVIDGDTVVLSATAGAKTPDGKKLSGETVRLLGVDAPEIARPPHQATADCWGDESHRAARNLMQGLTIELEFGANDVRDDFDRLLAYIIMPDGKVANEILIEDGDARSYQRFRHRYRSRYEALEEKARDRNLGVWTCR
jgi:micrococcal nuclease